MSVNGLSLNDYRWLVALLIYGQCCSIHRPDDRLPNINNSTESGI